MSRLRLNKVANPSTTPVGSGELFESTDNNRLKFIDENGVVSVLFGADWDKNVLTNGGFGINQRLASALTNIPSPSATARVFTCDRWGFTVGNVATPQFQQVDARGTPVTGLQASFYGKFKQLTNPAKIFISQVVPAVETMPLRGRAVRFQVRARYSVGSNRTMRMGLMQLTSAGTIDTIPATFISAFNVASTDPTLGTNLSYIAPSIVENGSIVGSAVNFTLTNTFQRFSAVFTVPSNCLNIIAGIWSDGLFIANDDLDISECGLYDGMEINDWIPIQQSLELVRCQRFFAKTFQQAVAPAQNAGLLGASRCPVTTAGAVATSIVGTWRFPVTMFKAPTTVTFYNPLAVNAFVRNVTLSTDATVTASANISDCELDYNATGLAGWLVGNDTKIHITADAEI